MSELVLQAALLEEPALRGSKQRVEPLMREPAPAVKRQTHSEIWAATGLTIVVVAMRLWLASRVTFCGTPDSCFYLGLAQGIERTGSFRVNFVYDLLLPHLQLPNTGIEYWRPGTSLLLLPAHLLGGVTLHRSAAIATLAGVVWALAAWYVARQLPATRKLALPSYALALLLPPAWTGSLTPDSTLFYAAAVAWFLALFTARRQAGWQDGLALGCVSVAYLIRNDAVLLLVPLTMVLVLRRRERPQSDDTPGASSGYVLLMLGGFVLALLPMHLLYRRVLGTAWPGGTAQALWMNDLSDFNLYGVRPTAAGLLAHGLPHLLTQRVSALMLIVYRVAVILLGYAALLFLPGALLKGRPRRSSSEGSPASLSAAAGPLAFGATLLLVYSFALPAIGVFSALRSVVGMLPWTAVLVMAGLARMVPEARAQKWACGVLLAAYAVGGVMETRREVQAKNTIGDRDRRLSRALAALGAAPGSGPNSAVVMTADPVQFAVTTGYSTVPVPGNGLDAALAEARSLGVTHVMLNLDSQQVFDQISQQDSQQNAQPVSGLDATQDATQAATQAASRKLNGEWRGEASPRARQDRLQGGEPDAARILRAVRSVRMREEHLVLLQLDREAR